MLMKYQITYLFVLDLALFSFTTIDARNKTSHVIFDFNIIVRPLYM